MCVVLLFIGTAELANQPQIIDIGNYDVEREPLFQPNSGTDAPDEATFISLSLQMLLNNLRAIQQTDDDNHNYDNVEIATNAENEVGVDDTHQCNCENSDSDDDDNDDGDDPDSDEDNYEDSSENQKTNDSKVMRGLAQ